MKIEKKEVKVVTDTYDITGLTHDELYVISEALATLGNSGGSSRKVAFAAAATRAFGAVSKSIDYSRPQPSIEDIDCTFKK